MGLTSMQYATFLERTTSQGCELALAAHVLEAIWSRVVTRRIALADAIACAIAVATQLSPLVMVTRGSTATN